MILLYLTFSVGTLGSPLMDSSDRHAFSARPGAGKEGLSGKWRIGSGGRGCRHLHLLVLPFGTQSSHERERPLGLASSSENSHEHPLVDRQSGCWTKGQQLYERTVHHCWVVVLLVCRSSASFLRLVPESSHFLMVSLHSSHSFG